MIGKFPPIVLKWSTEIKALRTGRDSELIEQLVFDVLHSRPRLDGERPLAAVHIADILHKEFEVQASRVST